MKLHSLTTCLVLCTTLIASAQSAGTQLPAAKAEAGTGKLPSGTGKNGGLRELILQPGLLEEVVEELKAAYRKSTLETGSAENQVPTLIYGPGARGAKIAVPLHLTGLGEMRAVDALVLIAASAGCIVEPIYSLPVEGDEHNQHIIGHCFQLAPGRPFSTSLSPSGDEGGGVPGAGGPIVGIGVALEAKDGYIVIGDVTPGSPADRIHAFKPGDRILRVADEDVVANRLRLAILEEDLAQLRQSLSENHPKIRELLNRIEVARLRSQEDVDVTGFPLIKVVELIRGTPGSVVRLTLLSETPTGPLTHMVSLAREKLNLPPPDAMIPKVAVVSGGTLTSTGEWNFDGRTNASQVFQLKRAAEGQLKAIDASIASTGGSSDGTPSVAPARTPPSVPPGSATTPQENDTPVVRIYALGSIFSGNDQAMKEDDFKKLVAEALDRAGVRSGATSVLYIHTKSRVLIARATAGEHEIIGQVVTALKENEAQQTIPKKQ